MSQEVAMKRVDRESVRGFIGVCVCCSGRTTCHRMRAIFELDAPWFGDTTALGEWFQRSWKPRIARTIRAARQTRCHWRFSSDQHDRCTDESDRELTCSSRTPVKMDGSPPEILAATDGVEHTTSWTLRTVTRSTWATATSSWSLPVHRDAARRVAQLCRREDRSGDPTY